MGGLTFENGTVAALARSSDGVAALARSSVCTVLALLLYTSSARATDIQSLHLDVATFATEPGTWLLSAGIGASYELLLSGGGLRFGLVTGPLAQPDRDEPLYSWTVAPELAYFFGGDSAPMHWMISAQPVVLEVVGLHRGRQDAVQGWRIGPEIELRNVPASYRARIGLLYAPTRLPSGRWLWGAACVRISLELGTPEEGVVRPSGELCPNGRAPLVGTGCD
ncbi:MAG TPA: hypothetical protein VK509_14790 [Polyangiales bacterium]|nr:hypothetical protein [Polyangiales bacterium]